MRRTMGIVLFTAAAVLLVELLLQTPLYRWLQPAILTPVEGAVVSPPLLVQWDGPRQLHLSLAADGNPPLELGVHKSPFELSSAELSASGTYRLEARALILGSLIQTARRFRVATPSPKTTQPSRTSDVRLSDLSSALNSLRTAHEQTLAENTALYEENAGLRHENALLLQEVERGARAQEEAAGRITRQVERQAELTEENQALGERLGMLQWQLNSALRCSVWGYYSFPRPRTIPPNRRTVTISNLRGDVFRREAECEAQRQADPDAASKCFCVDNPWTG